MDEIIFRQLHPLLLHALGEPAWRLITSKLTVALVLAAAAIWAKREGRWRLLGIALASGLLAESLSSQVIKPLIAAPRPCLTEGLSLLSLCSSTFSMPSSHATSIVAGLLPLAIAWRQARPALALVGLLFVASRLALGMHWPSDLLVGAAIGALIGLAAWRVENHRHPG